MDYLDIGGLGMRFWKYLSITLFVLLLAVGGYAARTEYFVHTTTTTAVIGTVDINGGTIDGAVIGGTTPAAGTFTTVGFTSVDIDGGTIDATVIGGAVPAAGTFTAGTFTTGTIATADINGGAIDGTAIGGAVPGAGAFTTLSSSGLATLASVDINGGAVDGANVGAATPGTGAFTTLRASTDPVDEHGVGDRGFNDTRYLGVSYTEYAGYIRGLEVSYKDTDEVYVSGGATHVYDGVTHRILTSTSQITKAITGHGWVSKPIYFYVDTPASGTSLVAADVEYEDSAPTYNHSRMGWYHPTTTDWRFIGSIPVDAGGLLKVGYRTGSGHEYQFDARVTVDNAATDAYTDILSLFEFMPHIDNAMATLYFEIVADAGDARSIYIRKNGSAGAGIIVCEATASDEDTNMIRLAVDSGGVAEWKKSNAAASANVDLYGYWEPR